MHIFTEAAMVILALIAASCGVIGMLASIRELTMTREFIRRWRRKEGDR